MPKHLPLPTPEVFRDRRQGGGAFPPTERNRTRHGAALRRQIQQATRQERRPISEGIDPRHVFKVRTVSRVDDATWRPRGLEPLGESTEGWQYVVITRDSEGDVTALEQALDRYAHATLEQGETPPLASFFGGIHEISPYGSEDRRGPGIPAAGIDEATVVDVELWPAESNDAARSRLAEARSVVSQTDGEILHEDARRRFTVVRARVTPDGLDELLDLPVVQRLRIPPIPYLDPADWIDASSEQLSTARRDGEPVGVVDDGVVAGHPLLHGLVRNEVRVPDTRIWAAPGTHGTMVAGLAAYGDFEQPLRDGDALHGYPIYAGRILEPHPEFADRALFPTELAEHESVEQAIRRLHAEHGVRVFNLSVTDDAPYTGPHASPWTEMIDALVRELGIVCVVAAGNRRMSASPYDAQGNHQRDHYPQYLSDPHSRIAEPAPAALALTIGSIARSAAPATPTGATRVGDRAIAPIGYPSPFTRTGPGLREKGSIKPELVHYGGNWVIDDTDRLQSHNPGVATVSLNADYTRREFAGACGTSFSAPRVAHAAARLWDEYPEASANMIRALIGLSTDLPSSGTTASQEAAVLQCQGYGRPDLGRAAASTQHRVVLSYDGAMLTDSVVLHAVPIPPEFARRKRARRRIRVALAFDPPVRRHRHDYLEGWYKADLLRAMTVDEIEEIYRSQDPDDRRELITNRRRLKLRPPKNRVLASTLQIRETVVHHLRPDDGDTYFLVLTHFRAPWSDPTQYQQQSYAVCVELAEEQETDIDLYNLVRQHARVRAETEVRLST